MKTFFRVWIFSGLVLVIVVFFICSKLNAQTIIRIESSSDSTIVMKIQNTDIHEQPQKLLLIIDSILFTYQLAEGNVYASLDLKERNYFQSDPDQNILQDYKYNKADDNLMNYLIDKTLHEETEAEDLIEIEEWMYNSEGWLNE
ncbi:MAG: hypothetical protein JXB24_08235 [Bacteroidales bacterium]|nr:hypothetical protein [Bacteroidales bacterium]